MSEIRNVNEFFQHHPDLRYKDLARYMGVSVSSVQKWMRGERRITERTISQLNTLHERFSAMAATAK